jgi:hypothetical protein
VKSHKNKTCENKTNTIRIKKGHYVLAHVTFIMLVCNIPSLSVKPYTVHALNGNKKIFFRIVKSTRTAVSSSPKTEVGLEMMQSTTNIVGGRGT